MSLNSDEKLQQQTIEDLPPNLKLDEHGLPLVPQPTDHVDDPLNWPTWYKYYVLFLLCLLAFVCQFGASFLTAAFAPISKEFHVTIQQASYLTTSYIVMCGWPPLLVTPFVNLYGRRPAYILATLVAMVANIGGGYANSYAGQVVGRVFVGLGASVALAIGGATICDMFFQGQRGRFMGFYALALTNGPHFGPIAGGYIALNIGWRWILYVMMPSLIAIKVDTNLEVKINAIMLGAVLFLFIFTFPETLYSRDEFSNLEQRSYWSKLWFSGKVLNRPLSLKQIGYNVRMLQYWAVLLPCIYYATANTYGSALFVLSMSSIASELYHFNTAQTGLLIGVPLTIGCLIGEACTGWISDLLINRYAKRHNGYRKPETRLYLAPIALLLPVGVIIHGVCVQNKTPWIGLAVGEVVASIGVQAATTLTYAYCTDCYKPQSAEISTLINAFRNLYAFTLGFYALPFGKADGFGVAWGTLAAVNFVAWLPLLVLIWKGEEIRKRQGTPRMHVDL